MALVVVDTDLLGRLLEGVEVFVAERAEEFATCKPASGHVPGSVDDPDPQWLGEFTESIEGQECSRRYTPG
jgi:hypothetical protein